MANTSSRNGFTAAGYCRFAVAAIVFLAASAPEDVRAQSGFFTSFGPSITDARLNAQFQAESVAPTPEISAPTTPPPSLPGGPASMETMTLGETAPIAPTADAPEPCSLLSLREANLAYSYSFKHEKAAPHIETSVHAVSPSLLLLTRHGTAIRPSVLYYNADTDVGGTTIAETNAVGGTLSLSQELLDHFGLAGGETYGCHRFPEWELTANLDGGYRDIDIDVPAAPNVDLGSWSAGAGTTLVYHAIRPKLGPAGLDPTGALNLALSATYRYEENRFVISTAPPAEAQLVALEGRVDYVVAPIVMLVGKISWFHDLESTVPSAPDPKNEDWAAFEIAPIFLLGQWRLATSISYEAFHSDYYDVRAAGQITYSF